MSTSQKKIKRLLDVSFGLFLLLISLIIIIPISLLIKLQDGGPAISKHIRVGKNSQLFIMYKLRTRRRKDLTAVNLGGVSLEGLERIPENFRFDKDEATISSATNFGKWLRRTRLDELPQLWNVVIGNMSLVGPRPELREIADHFDDEQRTRLSVRPGLTGLAQVSGIKQISYSEKIQLDNAYIKSYHLALDIKILCQTVILPWKMMTSSKQPEESRLI